MSGWFDPGFTTDALSDVFSPEAWAAAMVRFEVALAAAEAECGIIDVDAAAEIAVAAEAIIVDATEVFRAGWEAGTPVIPLLEQMREQLPAEAGEALHRGATTQDVVDTATMLQIAEAFGLLLADVDPLVSDLAALARTHRDTPTLARDLSPTGRCCHLRFAGGLLAGACCQAPGPVAAPTCPTAHPTRWCGR